MAKSIYGAKLLKLLKSVLKKGTILNCGTNPIV